MAVVACCAALFATGASCKKSAPATKERMRNGAVVLAAESEPYVKVEPAAAATGAKARSLVARVAFDERHVAALGPPVQGRVASVSVVVGDKVERGALLVTISAPDIAAARAQVTEAKTARALAETTAKRSAMLADKGAGSDAERQQAEAALLQARSEETRAIAALTALGGGVSSSGSYQLRAPIAGIVVQRNASVGTVVHTDQDQPVVTVADLTNVWVLADVYEQDLARVHVGDEAAVEVLAFPGRKFVGKITQVGSTIDPQTRVARARIELSNEDLALRPGMFANVQAIGISAGGVEIPISAVLARRDQFFVFVRNADGSYSRREIQRGDQHGQHVSVLSGLKAGEPVVSEGAILLDAEANEAL